ncbi:TauD/TfdA family dioxygenase [Streptomyces sp. NPDC050485]|uniref:TauD/TfdA family dioxygenase n=1 Tax=Streptomyces sp. NPDC050485 TaxID=3365617 RepID=UPI0037AA5D7F
MSESRRERRARQLQEFSNFDQDAPDPVPGLPPDPVSLSCQGPGPAIVEPAVDDVDLAGWCATETESIRSLLNTHGGILFRGFRPPGSELFQRFFTAVCPDSMDYQDRSSPRSVVGDRLYTSTDHPADQTIVMHSELSYSASWPALLAFYSDKAADAGGETPIADTRVVLQNLSAPTRERFMRLGVRYRRELRTGVGLSWQEVLGTQSRDEAELTCRELGMRYEWIEDGLRVEWTRPAVRQHHITGEQVWFNHAAFFHVDSVEPGLADALEAAEMSPFTTAFGDGSPITGEVATEIRSAYERALVVRPWVTGDILLLDNMLMAHGRLPYQGARRLLVMMGGPVSS